MISGNKEITVKTDIVEMSGGDRNVYFELNGSKCSAKVPLEYHCGESIKLNISEKDMYIFDKNTGVNLLYR